MGVEVRDEGGTSSRTQDTGRATMLGDVGSSICVPGWTD